MFNLNKILKEAKWIGKISLLQEMQIKNMVGQLFAKHKDKIAPENVNKEKEKFLEFANKINEKIIKNLKVDFKNEKNVLVWILEQVFLNIIDEDRLEEDLDIIKENLEIYFKNKGKINKTLDKLNYSELKEIVNDYKQGGEQEKHQEFLSKPDYEGNGYKIYKITEIDQCLKIGKGTSWCIQGEKRAKEYLSKGPLYLVTKKNKRYALLSFETAQFMDVNDNELDDEITKDIFKVFDSTFLEESLKSAIKEDSYIIRFINNPSEELQIEAVKQDGRTIQYIKDPSEKIKLEAVKQDATVIQYIKNPSEELQLEAVKSNGRVIKYIEDPSEQVQLEAIKNFVYAIKEIENPTEKAQLEAIKIEPIVIKFLNDTSDKLKLEAVKLDGTVIQYIKNPSEEMQIAAVEQNIDAIQYVHLSPKILDAIKSKNKK